MSIHPPNWAAQQHGSGPCTRVIGYHAAEKEKRTKLKKRLTRRPGAGKHGADDAEHDDTAAREKGSDCTRYQTWKMGARALQLRGVGDWKLQ